MKAKEDNPVRPSKQARDDNYSQGYPIYPANEDIYNKYHEEKDIDPEDLSESKKSNTKEDTSSINIIKEINVDMPGEDLDIPGSELDDEMENIGSEDEENNYYSLGGDEHNNLEENQ